MRAVERGEFDAPLLSGVDCRRAAYLHHCRICTGGNNVQPGKGSGPHGASTQAASEPVMAMQIHAENDAGNWRPRPVAADLQTGPLDSERMAHFVRDVCSSAMQRPGRHGSSGCGRGPDGSGGAARRRKTVSSPSWAYAKYIRRKCRQKALFVVGLHPKSCGRLRYHTEDIFEPGPVGGGQQINAGILRLALYEVDAVPSVPAQDFRNGQAGNIPFRRGPEILPPIAVEVPAPG